jgi:hypothetical protein
MSVPSINFFTKWFRADALARRSALVTTVLICACSFVWGQQLQADAEPGTAPVVAPKLSVKWSVLHLMYFYPSWQFSLEHRLLKTLNIQYDGGWVVNSQPNFSGYENKRGYRMSVELRYYLPSSPKMVPFYFAGELYYHNIRFDRSETIGFNCATGMCDYYQFVTYPVRTEELGPGVKFGMLMFPGWRKNRSFFFDLNGGLAYRKINYSYSSRPSGEGIMQVGDIHGFRLFAPDEAVSERIRFIIGARFCYRFL